MHAPNNGAKLKYVKLVMCVFFVVHSDAAVLVQSYIYLFVVSFGCDIVWDVYAPLTVCSRWLEVLEVVSARTGDDGNLRPNYIDLLVGLLFNAYVALNMNSQPRRLISTPQQHVSSLTFYLQ